MTVLKLATEEDLPELVKLSEKLFSDSYYALFSSFDSDVVRDTFRRIINDNLNNVVIILYSDNRVVAFIAGTIINQLFHSRDKVAVELGFWINEKARTLQNIRLLYGAYRYWAKMNDCDLLQMGKIKTKNKPEEFYYRKLK